MLQPLVSLPVQMYFETSLMHLGFFVLHLAGPLLQDMHFRRGPMVEKAVQTIQMENSRPVRGLASSQEQQWDRRQLQRPRYDTYQNQRDVDVKSKELKLLEQSIKGKGVPTTLS